MLAQRVIHADETPVQMLTPGEKKTHRAYVWAYSTTSFADLKAVVYDFSPSRAGEHARNFLGQWNGKLVCDDFAGYKASFEQGITEIGCIAHARRKFFDLHAANKSQLAEQALHSIGGLYEIERQARDMSDEDRWRIRQEKAAPLIDALHTWLLTQRDLVPEGSAIAKALDYSLKRWAALARYVDDGAVPIGRVGMWRGGLRSVSTPRSSNRTCAINASGFRPRSIGLRARHIGHSRRQLIEA
mgnify:FL=1